MSHLRYIEQFLSFRCAGDIINVTHPVQSMAKEISESMAMLRHVKVWILKKPKQRSIIDLCSGNALLPIMTAFMLPIRASYAVDKRPRERHWERVKYFHHLNIDIHDKAIRDFLRSIKEPFIMTAIHPCRDLAERIVELYLQTEKARKLALMPCCIGQIRAKTSDKVKKRIGRDNLWALQLAGQANGRVIQDDDVISPKNRIVIAEK